MRSLVILSCPVVLSINAKFTSCSDGSYGNEEMERHRPSHATMDQMFSKSITLHDAKNNMCIWVLSFWANTTTIQWIIDPPASVTGERESGASDRLVRPPSKSRSHIPLDVFTSKMPAGCMSPQGWQFDFVTCLWDAGGIAKGCIGPSFSVIPIFSHSISRFSQNSILRNSLTSPRTSYH